MMACKTHLSVFHCLQTGPGGRVVGIEHINSLVQMSVKNVQADDPELLNSGRIKFVGECCHLEYPNVFLNNIISPQKTKKKKITDSVHSWRWKAWPPGWSAI